MIALLWTHVHARRLMSVSPPPLPNTCAARIIMRHCIHHMWDIHQNIWSACKQDITASPVVVLQCCVCARHVLPSTTISVAHSYYSLHTAPRWGVSSGLCIFRCRRIVKTYFLSVISGWIQLNGWRCAWELSVALSVFLGIDSVSRLLLSPSRDSQLPLLSSNDSKDASMHREVWGRKM